MTNAESLTGVEVVYLYKHKQEKHPEDYTAGPVQCQETDNVLHNTQIKFTQTTLGD